MVPRRTDSGYFSWLQVIWGPGSVIFINNRSNLPNKGWLSHIRISSYGVKSVLQINYTLTMNGMYSILISYSLFPEFDIFVKSVNYF